MLDEIAIRQRLKDDFQHYASRCLHIRSKAGDVIPLNLNKAQLYLHSKAEEQRKKTGKVRIIGLKGRQQGFCLAPETRVLTADLKWVEISKLQVGIEVISCDEEPNGEMRRMRTAIVQAVSTNRVKAFRLTMSDGRQVVCSENHRWLTKNSQTQWYWRCLRSRKGGLKVGTSLRSIVFPWNEPDLEDAWFAGVMDGEGSFDYKLRSGVRMAVSQRAGAVLDRMQAHCSNRGYGHYIISDDGPRKTKLGQLPVHAVNISNMESMFRLLGLSNTSRFSTIHWWDGKRMPDGGEREVVSIESLGEMDLVDIQTSTGTFIAEGFVSHNSTYVEARFYWRVTHRRGVRAFILTHEQDATDNLFEIAQRYHEHCPVLVRPQTSAANAKELLFNILDSGYKVGTAGTKGTGRSSTIQYFHGSEVGYWANAETHIAGVMQAIPDMDDTEIFLESTANGIGNAFHTLWQQAEMGEGEYEPVFIPWFWQDEYQKSDVEGLTLTAEEQAYKDFYNLTINQMAWRRAKILELKSETLFKQEYPATPAEAFQVTGFESFIKADLVLNARKRHVDAYGPLVVGVDPARFGDDRTAIAFRRTRKVTKIDTHKKKDTMETAGICAKILKNHQPAMMFIDVVGIGAGVVDRLNELGWGGKIMAVGGGERANAQDRYVNRRAEMWGEMKDWFETNRVQIPDTDELHADLQGPGFKYDSSQRLVLEKKEDMKKRGVRSPDLADAIALTFAAQVNEKQEPLPQQEPDYFGMA